MYFFPVLSDNSTLFIQNPLHGYFLCCSSSHKLEGLLFFAAGAKNELTGFIVFNFSAFDL